MKPLPVSLSPSARNMPARTGGRGTSALRASSAKQNAAAAGRKQMFGSKPRPGAFGVGNLDDAADELDQAFEAAAEKSAEREKEKEAARQAEPPAKEASAAPAPSAFQFRKEAPPEQAPLPLTPNKLAANRGLLSIGGHAPRASSPLAQQPPVTASPDSSVAEATPPARSAFAFGGAKPADDNVQPASPAPISFPSFGKADDKSASSLSLFGQPSKSKEQAAAPTAPQPAFSFGAPSSGSSSVKPTSFGKTEATSGLGHGKPPAPAATSSPFSFAPAPPAGPSTPSGPQPSSAGEAVTTTPQTAPPPSNPFAGFGAPKPAEPAATPVVAVSAPTPPSAPSFTFGAPKEKQPAQGETAPSVSVG
jgi:nuclear pore complex protein Nup62